MMNAKLLNLNLKFTRKINRYKYLDRIVNGFDYRTIEPYTIVTVDHRTLVKTNINDIIIREEEDDRPFTTLFKYQNPSKLEIVINDWGNGLENYTFRPLTEMEINLLLPRLCLYLEMKKQILKPF